MKPWAKMAKICHRFILIASYFGRNTPAPSMEPTSLWTVQTSVQCKNGELRIRGVLKPSHGALRRCQALPPLGSENRESGLIWVEKVLEPCKDSVLHFQKCHPCLHRLSRVQQLKLSCFLPSAAHLWCSYVDILIRLQMYTLHLHLIESNKQPPHSSTPMECEVRLPAPCRIVHLCQLRPQGGRWPCPC